MTEELVGCPECIQYQEIPKVPHLVSKCKNCGRVYRFVRKDKDGRSITIRDGESLTIPGEFLSFSFNPLKSNAIPTKFGLEFYAKRLFIHNMKADKSKDILKLVEEYKQESEKILSESTLIKGLDIENEDDQNKIVKIIEENQDTIEFWALNTCIFADMALDAVNSNDIKTAVWAVKSCEQCRMMLIYKNELEEVIWMGHGAKSLINLLNYWNNNKSNPSEAFWQGIFKEYSFALSQIFSFPVIFIQENAYVGGQKIDKHDSNFADFLFQTDISGDSIIIEIKNPTTKLLGGKYRKVYPVSSEISGSIVQISSYKQSLINSIYEIRNDRTKDLKALNPKTVIIAGNSSVELNSPEKMNSFELFRSNLKDTTIITYDELFRKIELLCQIFHLKSK